MNPSQESRKGARENFTLPPRIIDENHTTTTEDAFLRLLEQRSTISWDETAALRSLFFKFSHDEMHLLFEKLFEAWKAQGVLAKWMPDLLIEASEWDIGWAHRFSVWACQEDPNQWISICHDHFIGELRDELFKSALLEIPDPVLLKFIESQVESAQEHKIPFEIIEWYLASAQHHSLKLLWPMIEMYSDETAITSAFSRQILNLDRSEALAFLESIGYGKHRIHFSMYMKHWAEDNIDEATTYYQSLGSRLRPSALTGIMESLAGKDHESVEMWIQNETTPTDQPMAWSSYITLCPDEKIEDALPSLSRIPPGILFDSAYDLVLHRLKNGNLSRNPDIWKALNQVSTEISEHDAERIVTAIPLHIIKDSLSDIAMFLRNQNDGKISEYFYTQIEMMVQNGEIETEHAAQIIGRTQSK